VRPILARWRAPERVGEVLLRLPPPRAPGRSASGAAEPARCGRGRWRFRVPVIVGVAKVLNAAPPRERVETIYPRAAAAMSATLPQVIAFLAVAFELVARSSRRDPRGPPPVDRGDEGHRSVGSPRSRVSKRSDKRTCPRTAWGDATLFVPSAVAVGRNFTKPDDSRSGFDNRSNDWHATRPTRLWGSWAPRKPWPRTVTFAVGPGSSTRQ